MYSDRGALAEQMAQARARAAALDRQRTALAAILSRPARWPWPVWHWAYVKLKAAEPGDYALLYRVVGRAA